MIKNLFDFVRRKYFYAKAVYRSKSTHPDDLSIELIDLFDDNRQIRVAIIDNDQFYWIDAIRQMGCKVEYFSDYTKPLTQSNQKIKPIDLSSYDLVICDLHGVGEQLYPGLGGVGVLMELRNKNPLQVIVAYTGDPGEVVKRTKKKDIVDATFCKDWSPEDFLFNLDELLKIYKLPKYRWEFIRKRLSYLEVPGGKVEAVRQKYVENIILAQMLREKLNYSAHEARNIITGASENSIDYLGLINYWVSAGKVVGLVLPYIWENGK
ncbi:hypothetical protein [Sphaerotilus sp.]|uniref:hypothetical protein n=1 Tax=Sphaerotilus sp. TaxID=2093942 RepID=UPI002ACD6010|nr:hypothetical protein [Sphaerotilus sp.]MDZ7854845.1 hypothetical protein [Sphaerotilus sp.]